MKKLLVIPFLVLAGLLAYQFLLKVDKITCKTQYGPCPPVIEGQIQKLRGKSVYAIDKSLKNLLKEGYGVNGYFTQFRLPNSLDVTIQQAKPEFALQYKDSPSTLLVDSTGEVLGIEKSANLPRVVSDRSPKDTGEKVSPEELFSLSIIKDIYLSYSVPQGSLEGDTLKLDLGKVFVWFPTQGERQILLTSLKLILAEIEAKSDIFAAGKKTIDLRFKNPVIK